VGVEKAGKHVYVFFYSNDRGKMPVREWLLCFSRDDKKIIGEDIKTVEFSWPIGMPTVRPLGNKLYEVRPTLTDRTKARIIFTIYKNKMVLLHGFIKKDRKTRLNALRLAKDRLKKFNKIK